MSNIIDPKMELYYIQTLEIWEKFCLLHKELYELTAKEYLLLLENNLEELTSITNQKELIFKDVNAIESHRNDIISDLNKNISEDNKIKKVSELIAYFRPIEEKRNLNSLLNLHNLLINIIEQLQEQNKKNQIYINKAILSAKELQESFKGKKSFKTYGADGLTKSNQR